MKVILSFVFCLIIVSAFSQNNTPTYTWRMHQPYESVKQIVETDKFLYVLSDLGIYSFDLSSGEIERLTKVEGFAEAEVACMAYSNVYQTLVIGYANGNIDLLKNNRIINFDIVLKNDNLIGAKDIYEIKCIENRAYFATSFGVVVLDIDKEVPVDDYQNLGQGGTSLGVSSLDILNDTLYLGTPEGLKYAPAYINSVNLKNFSSWETLTSFDSATSLEVFNSKLYFVSKNILYSQVNGNVEVVGDGLAKKYKSIVNSHNELIICRTEGIARLSTNDVLTEVGEMFMDYAITDYQNNLWFGAFYRGLIKRTPNTQYGYVRPVGPFDVTNFDMMGQGNKMWVTAGGYTTAFAPTYSDRGFYLYEDGNWFNSSKSSDALVGMTDVTNILVNPNNDEIWLGSFGRGLAQIVNQKQVARFDHTNSTIKSDPADRDIALGMALDSKGNLWVSNYGTSKALAVKKTDNTWSDYSVGTSSLGEMIVDESDQLWAIAPRTSSIGVVAMKETANGTIQRRLLTSGENNGGLPNNNVKAIAVDKDNEIWVGTEAGIAVFYNPSLVFEGGKNADAQQIVIDDGNDVGVLLGNEVVNDIKIDGANRKWIATNNGAWLVKEDGSGIILHFTSENSPLPSSLINCIGIVPNTGEVFFGTSEGIASFRGDATEASMLHKNTLVFPNPVHPEYEGPITITGLPEDATVKIADVAGRVVYELIATGGTAVWDGLDFNGNKPKTGVYLIYSANKDDEDSLVSKLLIVR